MSVNNPHMEERKKCTQHCVYLQQQQVYNIYPVNDIILYILCICVYILQYTYTLVVVVVVVEQRGSNRQRISLQICTRRIYIRKIKNK